jgi:hypothetical protein
LSSLGKGNCRLSPYYEVTLLAKKEVAMTIKELLHVEIERLDDEDLEAVYDLIRAFTQANESASSFQNWPIATVRPVSEDAEPLSEWQTREKKVSLFQKLLEIQIDAPEDFSVNLDHYMFREEHDEDDAK